MVRTGKLVGLNVGIGDIVIKVLLYLDDEISNTNIQPDQFSCSDHRGLFSWTPM
jgi:hypothetical protein